MRLPVIITLLFCLPAQAQDFEHFMLKEMYEQKSALARTITSLELDLSQEILKKISSINLVGAGTSMHAGYISKYFFEYICKIPVTVSLSSEFACDPFFHDQNTLHIILSQSGETTDTLEALRLINTHNQKTLAIINVAPSTMTQEASSFLHLQAGPEISVASTKVFSNHLVALYWLANTIALARGDIQQEQMDQAISDLFYTGEILENSMKKYRPILEETGFINDYLAHEKFVFLGRHVTYPFALEAALKLKETSYLVGQTYPAGELRHGPIALVDNKTSIILFSVLDETIYQKLITNAQAVKACDGNLIVFAFEGQDELLALADTAFVIPRVNALLAPLAMTGLMQMLVYQTARYLGRPIDKPRNLVKAVVT